MLKNSNHKANFEYKGTNRQFVHRSIIKITQESLLKTYLLVWKSRMNLL